MVLLNKKLRHDNSPLMLSVEIPLCCSKPNNRMTPRNNGSKKMTKVIAVLNKNNANTIEKLHL